MRQRKTALRRRAIMMNSNYMSNYSYGEDCFEDIPHVLEPYRVKSVVFIGGKRALASSEAGVRTVCEKGGIRVTGSFVYGVECTAGNIEHLAGLAEVQEADAIFGFGGGKATDTAKMVAKAVDKPIFTFPTICSNCSSGTCIAVIYHEDGSLDHYGYPDTPAHIFINTKVIANAPAKYFWAGIGDGISKAPEVEHCVRHAKESTANLPHTAVLGAAIAASSKDAFYTYGKEGLEDVRQHRVSKAIEEIALDILVSTGYASNLTNQKDFYYNSCHAHAFYNGTTRISREGEYLHGQVVSFGVLVLHAYFEEDEEMHRIAKFNHSIKLPVTLAELGLTDGDADKVAVYAMETNEYKNFLFDEKTFAAAIRKVNAYGKTL